MEILKEEDRFLTVAEVAYVLGISYWTALNWVRKGEIKATKLSNGKWRILKSDLEEFIKKLYKEEEK